MGIGHGRGSPYQPPRTCAVLTPPYMPPPTTLTLFFACRIHPPSPCTRLLALRGLPIPPSIVHSPYTIQRVHTRLLAPPPYPFLSCSQQIRFGLQTPQEIVKCGVFHVYERALYKVGGTHAPVEHMPFQQWSTHPPTPSSRPLSFASSTLPSHLHSGFLTCHWHPQPLLESEQGPPPFLRHVSMCAIHSPTYPFPVCVLADALSMYLPFLPPSPCLCRCRSGRPMRMECWTDAWWGWGECGGGRGRGEGSNVGGRGKEGGGVVWGGGTGCEGEGASLVLSCPAGGPPPCSVSLFRLLPAVHHTLLCLPSPPGCEQQELHLRDMWAEDDRLRRTLWWVPPPPPAPPPAGHFSGCCVW